MYDEINGRNFTSEVIRSDIPVLLDFSAPWCTPSRMLSSVLEEISENYDGMIRVCSVDVDSNSHLADIYEIDEVPTVIFFKNGRPTDRFTGFRCEEEIESMISRI